MAVGATPTTLVREFCRKRSYRSENELSGGHHGSSTSECSSSTCDTSGSQRRSTRKLELSASRSPLYLIKRQNKKMHQQQQPDPNHVSIICQNCDSMRIQLTQAKTQCYDQWISRIKVLEDMLHEKQQINDEIQADFYEQCRLVEQEKLENASLKKANAGHAESILSLRQDNHNLKELLQQKEDYIEDLSEEIKRLREKDKLHNQLREMDRQTIERLRAALARNEPINSSTNHGSRKVKRGNGSTNSSPKGNRTNRHRKASQNGKTKPDNTPMQASKGESATKVNMNDTTSQAATKLSRNVKKAVTRALIRKHKHFALGRWMAKSSQRRKQKLLTRP